jgi:hypothetical protein
VPLANTVITPADVTVHRVGVLDVNVTAKSDVADAFEAILNGAVPTPPKKLAVTPVKSKLIVCGEPIEMLSTQNDAPEALPPVLSKVPPTNTKRYDSLVAGIVTEANCQLDTAVTVVARIKYS